jgi:hypothetical protein
MGILPMQDRANLVWHRTAVAAYSLLLVAGEAWRQDDLSPQHLPAPKWHQSPSCQATTSRLVQDLRYELRSRSIYFSGFGVSDRTRTEHEKTHPNLEFALFSAAGYS